MPDRVHRLSLLRRLSLAQQIFVLQLAVITLLIASGAVLAFFDARHDSESEADRRVLALATTVAQIPEVREALGGQNPSATLQPLAESIRRATGVDFVVVMGPDRTRYSHPDPAQIGQPFVGTVEPALAGRSFTETYTGTLGPSSRAVVPVLGQGGRVVGLVSVGITQTAIGREPRRQLPLLALVAVLALAVAAAGSFAISRRLRRQTLGLGPVEITRMYEHHDAVLHAVREGLLVVDQHRVLLLANDEAVRLLGLPADAEGRPVSDLGLDDPLAKLLASGRPAHDELYLAGEYFLVVNQAPAARDGRRLGTVTTLRDHTELQALLGELDSVRGFTEALRAQAHESANRLHAVVTMIELGHPERAVEFATAELASAQQLADRMVEAVEEPALAALLLGKAAQAHEKGVELLVTDDTVVRGTSSDPRDVVTLVGNLVDNAIDAALAAPPPRRVTVTARNEDDTLLVRVADSGPGLEAEQVKDAFVRGWSTKPADRLHGRGLGLALVNQVVDRYGGTVEVTNDRGAVFTVRLPRAVRTRDGRA